MPDFRRGDEGGGERSGHPIGPDTAGAGGCWLGRGYPLRSTMADIEPLDRGDARLLLKDGSRAPCSRRYRRGSRLG